MTSLGSFPRVMLACAIAALAVLAPGCATTSPGTVAQPVEGDALPKQLVERVVVVTLAPASSDSSDRITAELASAHGLRHVGAFPLTSIGVHCVVFEVPANRAMDEVVRGLTADPRVESAQPNQVFRNLAAGPPDPYASFQYGARAIRAPQAHRWATGRGVTVAVIDTGIETEHPDLQGRVAKTANFVDGGAQSFAHDRHGTAVAGVIGARANNNEGIFGVAPEADLIGIKACWHSTAGGLEARCSSWTLAKAIDFAVVNGTRVVNLSLGGPPDPLLTRLIAKAIERGTTVVAAAMEGPNAPGFPASLPEVIGVVASDSHNDVRSGEAQSRDDAGRSGRGDPDHGPAARVRVPLRNVPGRRSCLGRRRAPPRAGADDVARPGSPRVVRDGAPRDGQRRAGDSAGRCVCRAGQARGRRCVVGV